MMAHSPTETRILQCFRKSFRTSIFSLLQHPPSIRPMSHSLVKVLISSTGDLLNSTKSISFKILSSISRRTCGNRSSLPVKLLLILVYSYDVSSYSMLVVFNIAANGQFIKFPVPDRHDVTLFFFQDGTYRAYIHGLLGFLISQP